MSIVIALSPISSDYACHQAILKIAESSSIAAALLTTIAQVESGMGPLRQPWPWTVNGQGHDYAFKTVKGAVTYMEPRQRRGITSFAVDCFQINWHRHKVRSIAELIAPDTNTLIATLYLHELYQHHGSVVQTVAHYQPLAVALM